MKRNKAITEEERFQAYCCSTGAFVPLTRVEEAKVFLHKSLRKKWTLLELGNDQYFESYNNNIVKSSIQSSLAVEDFSDSVDSYLQSQSLVLDGLLSLYGEFKSTLKMFNKKKNFDNLIPIGGGPTAPTPTSIIESLEDEDPRKILIYLPRYSLLPGMGVSSLYRDEDEVSLPPISGRVSLTSRTSKSEHSTSDSTSLSSFRDEDSSLRDEVSSLGSLGKVDDISIVNRQSIRLYFLNLITMKQQQALERDNHYKRPLTLYSLLQRKDHNASATSVLRWTTHLLNSLFFSYKNYTVLQLQSLQAIHFIGDIEAVRAVNQYEEKVSRYLPGTSPIESPEEKAPPNLPYDDGDRQAWINLHDALFSFNNLQPLKEQDYSRLSDPSEDPSGLPGGFLPEGKEPDVLLFNFKDLKKFEDFFYGTISIKGLTLKITDIDYPSVRKLFVLFIQKMEKSLRYLGVILLQLFLHEVFDEKELTYWRNWDESEKIIADYRILEEEKRQKLANRKKVISTPPQPAPKFDLSAYAITNNNSPMSILSPTSFMPHTPSSTRSSIYSPLQPQPESKEEYEQLVLGAFSNYFLEKFPKFEKLSPLLLEVLALAFLPPTDPDEISMEIQQTNLPSSKKASKSSSQPTEIFTFSKFSTLISLVNRLNKSMLAVLKVNQKASRPFKHEKLLSEKKYQEYVNAIEKKRKIDSKKLVRENLKKVRERLVNRKKDLWWGLTNTNTTLSKTFDDTLIKKKRKMLQNYLYYSKFHFWTPTNIFLWIEDAFNKQFIYLFYNRVKYQYKFLGPDSKELTPPPEAKGAKGAKKTYNKKDSVLKFKTHSLPTHETNSLLEITTYFNLAMFQKLLDHFGQLEHFFTTKSNQEKDKEKDKKKLTESLFSNNKNSEEELPNLFQFKESIELFIETCVNDLLSSALSSGVKSWLHNSLSKYISQTLLKSMEDTLNKGYIQSFLYTNQELEDRTKEKEASEKFNSDKKNKETSLFCDLSYNILANKNADYTFPLDSVSEALIKWISKVLSVSLASIMTAYNGPENEKLKFILKEPKVVEVKKPKKKNDADSDEDEVEEEEQDEIDEMDSYELCQFLEKSVRQEVEIDQQIEQGKCLVISAEQIYHKKLAAQSKHLSQTYYPIKFASIKFHKILGIIDREKARELSYMLGKALVHKYLYEKELRDKGINIAATIIAAYYRRFVIRKKFYPTIRKNLKDKERENFLLFNITSDPSTRASMSLGSFSINRSKKLSFSNTNNRRKSNSNKVTTPKSNRRNASSGSESFIAAIETAANNVKDENKEEEHPQPEDNKTEVALRKGSLNFSFSIRRSFEGTHMDSAQSSPRELPKELSNDNVIAAAEAAAAALLGFKSTPLAATKKTHDTHHDHHHTASDYLQSNNYSMFNTRKHRWTKLTDQESIILENAVEDENDFYFDANEIDDSFFGEDHDEEFIHTQSPVGTLKDRFVFLDLHSMSFTLKNDAYFDFSFYIAMSKSFNFDTLENDFKSIEVLAFSTRKSENLGDPDPSDLLSSVSKGNHTKKINKEEDLFLLFNYKSKKFFQYSPRFDLMKQLKSSCTLTVERLSEDGSPSQSVPEENPDRPKEYTDKAVKISFKLHISELSSVCNYKVAFELTTNLLVLLLYAAKYSNQPKKSMIERKFLMKQIRPANIALFQEFPLHSYLYGEEASSTTNAPTAQSAAITLPSAAILTEKSAGTLQANVEVPEKKISELKSNLSRVSVLADFPLQVEKIKQLNLRADSFEVTYSNFKHNRLHVLIGSLVPTNPAPPLPLKYISVSVSYTSNQLLYDSPIFQKSLDKTIGGGMNVHNLPLLFSPLVTSEALESKEESSVNTSSNPPHGLYTYGASLKIIMRLDWSDSFDDFIKNNQYHVSRRFSLTRALLDTDKPEPHGSSFITKWLDVSNSLVNKSDSSFVKTTSLLDTIDLNSEALKSFINTCCLRYIQEHYLSLITETSDTNNNFSERFKDHLFLFQLSGEYRIRVKNSIGVSAYTKSQKSLSFYQIFVKRQDLIDKGKPHHEIIGQSESEPKIVKNQFQLKSKTSSKYVSKILKDVQFQVSLKPPVKPPLPATRRETVIKSHTVMDAASIGNSSISSSRNSLLSSSSLPDMLSDDYSNNTEISYQQDFSACTEDRDNSQNFEETPKLTEEEEWFNDLASLDLI